MMTDKEYAALVEDIRKHGQRESIIRTSDRKILDGRNRVRACIALGIEKLKEDTFEGTEENAIALYPKIVFFEKVGMISEMHANPGTIMMYTAGCE